MGICGRILKESVYFFLRWSGLARLVRKILARGGAAIVVYHDPTPETLDRHMEYLSRRYHFITMDRLADAIHAKDWSGIPANSLVVTFDDGYSGNARLLDVLKKYSVVPTIYLSTQVVNTRRKFWFLVPQAHGRNPGGYKKLSRPERQAALQQQFGFTETTEYPDESPQALSRNEIMKMSESVEFGAHTLSHPILTMCSPEESRDEIIESKKQVEALCGRECRHFAYPNGDYSDRDVETVVQAGFRSARTVDLGWNHVGTDPYRLKIVQLSDNAGINALAVQMSCITTYAMRLLKREGNWKGEHLTITPAAEKVYHDD